MRALMALARYLRGGAAAPPYRCGGFALALAQAPGDAALIQVVRGHFHLNAVADGDADPTFAHLAANRGEDDVFVWQFDAEHCPGEDDGDDAFNFNVFFFYVIHSVVLQTLSERSCAAEARKTQREKRKSEAGFAEPRS